MKADAIAKDEEIRLARGALSQAVIELENKTRFLNTIAAHRLESVMKNMIDLTHEGREKS